MLIRKSPEQIHNFLAQNQHRLDMPELWFGDEPNTYGNWASGKFYKDLNWFHDPIHDKENVRVAYAPPCDLVQTAGNQTINLIYQIVNDRHEKFLCERGAFAPSRKDIKTFNDGGIPPFSLESKHPLFTSFDIIGTTLAFPGFFVNLVKYFKDAGCSPLWKERDENPEIYPLVFCGGQVFAQPGPIEPVVDVVVIGEGEDGVSGSDGDPVGFPTLLFDVLAAKQDGSWFTKEGRIEVLHRWARDHRWIYVPRFYSYKHHDPRLTRKHYIAHERIYEDIPERPKRRWIKDIDAIPCCTAPIINAHDPSMGLGEIEASRSCTGKCSFCAEIYRYAPYRERSVEYLVKVFAENIRNSGSTNAFPTGFDFPCYSRKHELYVRLMQEVCADVDTQSSRVDHFVGEDSAWAKMAGQGGMRQLAVGVEGNSERLRMIMSKGATENIIIDAFMYAMENKFDKVKFFMIADWEWETSEDTQEIIELGRKLMQIRDDYGSTMGLRFSWTPLLVEAWTPLQWCRSVVEDQKLAGVYSQIKPLGIGYSLGKKTEHNYYYFMQIFHMADRLVGEIMVRVALELDQAYCGSVDRGFIEAMERRMAEVGLTWDHYFRRKDYDETFWWDHIDIDLPKDWFMGYHKKMIALAEATDPVKLRSRDHECEPTNDFVALPGQLREISSATYCKQCGEVLETIKKVDPNPVKGAEPHWLVSDMYVHKKKGVGELDRNQLVQIGMELQKENPKLKFSKPTLEKGMLVTNCDAGCCACMACEENESGKVDFYRDVMLKEYFKKNKEHDAQFKGYSIIPVDESTVTCRVQAVLEIQDDRRFMPNDFWVAAIRRALYRSGIPVTKNTIKLTSDVHGYKPYVAGVGYLEFGMLRDFDIDSAVSQLNLEMPVGLHVAFIRKTHRDADLLIRGTGYSAHYHYVLDADEATVKQHLWALQTNPDAEMNVKRDEYRKGLTTVKMRIHDWLHDMWLVSNGHELVLSMMMKYGEPTPYNVIAAAFKMTLIESHKTPCRLKGVYAANVNQIDFFSPQCINCGAVIQKDIVGYRAQQDEDYCVKCSDQISGRMILVGAQVPA